jgi:hypothetical protein
MKLAAFSVVGECDLWVVLFVLDIVRVLTTISLFQGNSSDTAALKSMSANCGVATCGGGLVGQQLICLVEITLTSGIFSDSLCALMLSIWSLSSDSSCEIEPPSGIGGHGGGFCEDIPKAQDSVKTDANQFECCSRNTFSYTIGRQASIEKDAYGYYLLTHYPNATNIF